MNQPNFILLILRPEGLACVLIRSGCDAGNSENLCLVIPTRCWPDPVSGISTSLESPHAPPRSGAGSFCANFAADQFLARLRVLATDPLIVPCYQSCYQFLQKPAQSTVNQGPPKWIISLKYKEQHESRRNTNQTHNPMVGGLKRLESTAVSHNGCRMRRPRQPLAQ
jgi:hypothetical protein